MQLPYGFFDDGYTKDGYLEAQVGMYPAVRFQYRPMTQPEISKHLDHVERRSSDAVDAAAREILSGHLVRWSFDEVPIDTETLRKLHPQAFKGLFAIVMGYAPSDVDPNWTDAQKREHAGEIVDANGAGMTVGQLTEGRDLGN